jgi:hypothetical protein
MRGRLLTPANVHFGWEEEMIQQRQKVLRLAYEKNPERFVKGSPKSPQSPSVKKKCWDLVN